MTNKKRANARRESMPSAFVEEKIGSYRPKVSRMPAQRGRFLAARQEMGGNTRGNVPPWPGSGDGDFHGTLAAIWVWSRAKNCFGDDRYSLQYHVGLDLRGIDLERFHSALARRARQRRGGLRLRHGACARGWPATVPKSSTTKAFAARARGFGGTSAWRLRDRS
jgi:hypothetical protein